MLALDAPQGVAAEALEVADAEGVVEVDGVADLAGFLSIEANVDVGRHEEPAEVHGGLGVEWISAVRACNAESGAEKSRPHYDRAHARPRPVLPGRAYQEPCEKLLVLEVGNVEPRVHSGQRVDLASPDEIPRQGGGPVDDRD